MAESSKGETDAWEVWAEERHRAATAARLLTCCLGIKAAPGFDLTVEVGEKEASPKLRSIGIGLYKNAFYSGPVDEGVTLAIEVVDEKGNALARSEETYHLGHALELLARLPLPLSPHADEWVKDAMGERRPGQGPHPLEAAGLSWLVPVKKQVITEHRESHPRGSVGSEAAGDGSRERGGRSRRRDAASKSSGSRHRGRAV